MKQQQLTRSTLCALAAASLLSGCTLLGPDFVTPDSQVAEGWIDTEDSRLKSEPTDQSEWWSVFDDPTLDTLIELAYSQNLPLRIAGLRILEARARLGIAVGTQFPQAQDAFGFLRHVELSENAPNVSSALDTSFRDVGVGFQAGWELDFWGRFRRGIESADANLIAEVANYDDVLVLLTASVADAYVQVRTFEERLALAHENVAIQERSLKITDVRFRNGITTELDVQQARSLLRNTQALIPRLETGLRLSKHALSNLLGIPPSELFSVLGAPGLIPAAPPEVAVGIPAELLRRRPDIRRAELQAAAQSAQVGIAMTDLYPRISLFGSVGLESGDTGSTDLGDLLQGDSLTAAIGPSFSWPILNYGRLKNNIRVQDARLQQLIVNYQDTVLRAAREVEDATVAYLKSLEQVEFLSDSVDAADRSVELALIQYRDGEADYTRVLDTQDFLVDQQDLLTATRGDVVRSLIAMYKALGGGWQIRAGREVVPVETQEEMSLRIDWGELLSPEVVPEATEPPGTPGVFERRPDW